MRLRPREQPQRTTAARPAKGRPTPLIEDGWHLPLPRWPRLALAVCLDACLLAHCTCRSPDPPHWPQLCVRLPRTEV